MAREDKSHYVPFAEQGISLIYKLSEHPDVICSEIIKKQAAACLSSSTNDSGLYVFPGYLFNWSLFLMNALLPDECIVDVVNSRSVLMWLLLSPSRN